VKVAAEATPPVCRIMDFSKFKYEQEKREREAKKHHKVGTIKEVRFGINIAEGDFQIKITHAKEFLAKGNKVRVRLFYRGRQMEHQSLGKALLDRITKELSLVAKIDKAPQQLGKIIITIFGPK
jgi:translation initiation factor IF-3